MKKLVILAASIALAAFLVYIFASRLFSHVWAADEATASGTAAWPGELGTLESARDRVTRQEPNAAAVKLTRLAAALPKDETVQNYVAGEITRGETAIGPPPALPDVAAIRDLLLREPVVWKRERGIVEVGNPETSERRGVQMTVARALIASALARARGGDLAAWDDLRAAWNLARSLETQPEMMEQTAALSISRMINAVAWKMPLPVPAWFAEVQARDHVAPLLAAFQYQTAAYWQDASFIPIRSHVEGIEHDRGIAMEIFRETRCDVTPRVNKHGSDLTSIWRRAFRYRAEREATANALRVREGRPVETVSRCADGSWSFDGGTLRFSREIAMRPPDRPMPLTLRLDP